MGLLKGNHYLINLFFYYTHPEDKTPFRGFGAYGTDKRPAAACYGSGKVICANRRGGASRIFYFIKRSCFF